jgi:hypothetical protein
VAQSNTITVTITASSGLAAAVAALTAGQSATFAPGTGSGISAVQFDWEARFFVDTLHGVCQVMGKRANASSGWAHSTYNIASNSWTQRVTEGSGSGWGAGNGAGHVYDNFTGDPATGDLYCFAGIGTNALQRFNYATQTWGTALSNAFQPGPPSGIVDPINGIVWHPNLFGTGDGGVIMCAVTDLPVAGLVYWRKSTGARTQVSTSIDAGNQSGSGLYFAAINKAIMGGQSASSGSGTPSSHILVTPNTTAGGTPTNANAGAPPIKTGGDSVSQGYNWGSIHPHPSDPTRVMLLERVNATRRVWQSTNGDTWTLKAYTHPFSVTTGISIGEVFGAYWAISSNSSVLWKPND